MKFCKCLGAVVVCLTMAMPGVATAQRFVKAPVYSQGSSPALQVASGDFNGDGNTDLAFVSTRTPPVVTIRLGTSDGKFNAGQAITLSDTAAGILAGDWNNDGVIDLAVTTYGAQRGVSNVSTLLGNGDGTFTLVGSFDASGNAGFMATADLNGDGITDIVVASISDDVTEASLMLGQGGGNFAKGTGLNVMGSAPDHPVSVVIADFNRDGIFDLAVNGVCSFDGRSTLAIVLGKGNGTFGVPRNYDTTTNDYDNLIAADLNGDGLLDLVNSGNELAVHIGRGDGTFAPPMMFAGVSDYGGFIAAGDWNKDGKADILQENFFGANYVGLLLGNGDGTFKAPSLFGTARCPESGIVASDFNHDGNLDAALPGFCDSNFTELLGDGTGKFQTRRSFALSAIPLAVATGYLDSDANLDLAVVGQFQSNLTVLPGNKNGAFRIGPTYKVTGDPVYVAIADLNADGKNDVATADSTSNTVSVFLGNGNGTLQAEATYATGTNPVFVAAADVNGDERLDLLTADQTGNSFSVLLATGSGYLTHVDYTVSSAVELAFGDFNRDGKLDLIVASRSGTAKVFLGNGDGTFSAGATLTAGNTPAWAAVGDVNNDGELDLVIANRAAALVSTFLGNGDGTFQPQVTSVAPNNIKQVILADFDRDGKLDAMLIEGSTTANAGAALLPGQGDGTFRQAQLYYTDGIPNGEVIGDFNLDRALDVAIANGCGAATVSVLANTGK